MAKKPKNKTKTKLPKTVGGVKIPKEWRTAATKLAEHPVLLDVVAAGLLAAAAALTETKGGAATSKLGEDATDAAKAGARVAARAPGVLKAVATAMGKALLDEATAAKDGDGGKGRRKAPAGK